MAERAEGRGAQRQERRLIVALLVLVLHAAIVVFGLVFAKEAIYNGPSVDQCPAVLSDDDLVHLPLRQAEGQEAQLKRWQACDARAVAKALTAVRNDDRLVWTLAIAFAVAFVNVVRWRRWRVAALIGGALAIAYVRADLEENAGLLRLLERGISNEGLHWWASVKFGAFIGALPLFLLSFADSVGKVFVARDKDRSPLDDEQTESFTPLRDTRASVTRVGRFASRWLKRLTGEPKPAQLDRVAEPIDDDGGLGVCCSGGGIRSAAFNLGALQALEEHKPPGAEDKDELVKVKWISAVSGGSYVAAAWVTARAKPVPEGQLKRWSRRSEEEDHLRRHASYMAPGLGGKLWALARFLFGFALNIGVIGLFLGVVFLPVGWAIDKADGDPVTPGGTVDLPLGGCIELVDGRSVTALPETTLRLDGAPQPRLFPDAPAKKPAPEGSAPTAELKITSDGKTVAEAKVNDDGAAGLVTGVDDGRQALGGVAITGGQTTTSSSTTSTSRPRTSVCPASAAVLPPDAGVPADVVNDRLPAGTSVRVRLDGPLAIRGSVRGCDRSLMPPECAPEAAELFAAGSGARLVQAPEAFLTVDRPVFVGADGLLSQACGAVACETFDSSQLRWVIRVPLVLTVLLGISLVIARTSKGTAKRSERWCRRFAIVTVVAWLIVVVVPWLVVWTENGRWGIEHRLRATSSTGTLALLAALFAQFVPFIGARGGASSGTSPGRVGDLVKRAGRRLRPFIISIAGLVVGPLLVIIVAIGFASYAAQHGWGAGQLGLWLGLVGPLGLLLSGGDLNEWSLHPYYRDRLRSAFAVDPRFDPPDDPREDPIHLLPETGPQLVICAAVNIADDRLTAPGRPVVSWIFSRDSVGSTAMARLPVPPDERKPSEDPPSDGAAENAGSKEAAQATPGLIEPHKLPKQFSHLAWTWTAVAVSGAAFSPAMGKMSRPERFLLALGNLRLGVWYPNPRYLADPEECHWYDAHHPRPWYLAKEALGLHKGNDRWVYVTDGGHYENLGLMELLRKGCREIYCFDASGDTPDTFGTIADAMRIARQELKVDIRFTPSRHMKPNDEGISALGVWAGTVDFPEGKPGWIVVAKLAVPLTAPFDIIDLARTLPSFPNHPTADQLYTDQKFEAYRALGHHLAEQAASLADDIRRRIRSDFTVKEAVEFANRKREPKPSTTSSERKPETT